MNKWLELLLGIILIVLPIYGTINYAWLGTAVLEFLKGAVVVVIVLIGILFFLMGLSDLKS